MRKYNKKHREAKRILMKKYCRRRKIEALELHGSTSCEICGMDRPECLVFHHRDPSTKSKYYSIVQLPEDRLLAELEKCDVLCKNCHATVHFEMED